MSEVQSDERRTDGEQTDEQRTDGVQTYEQQFDGQQMSDDIVGEKFPEYQETGFAIPDIEPEASFAENKEEIFRRNSIIAAEEKESPSYRVRYPDNIDAEEIFPGSRAVSVDKNTVQKSVLDKIKSFYAEDPRMKLITILCILAFMFFASAVIITSTRNSSDRTSINVRAFEKAEENARHAYNAASAGLTELAINGKVTDGNTFENKGTVFVFGSSETNVADYLGNYFTGYVYGSYNSEIFTVDYALWSSETIPDEYKRMLTTEEKEALAKQGIIIGCYPEID